MTVDIVTILLIAAECGTVDIDILTVAADEIKRLRICQPDWTSVKHDWPDGSGHYLCWDEAEQYMWIGAYNDTGGHDTWGDARKLGWAGGKSGTPTHWARRPVSPTIGEKSS